MRVAHLSLVDFRNYEVAEVPLRNGLNLIVGRNGQGKTNLVEAMAYFATLASHRVTSDAALIRAGQDSAVARMRIAVDDREVLLELQLNRSRANRAQVNRNTARPRDLTRWFSVVVFAPEDLSLLRGEPGLRRRFLDESVVARQPAFAATLADYERVVKQRTALLKSARSSGNHTAINETLEVWDARLIDLGTTIILERRRFVEAMRDPLRDSYAAIVEQDHRPTISMIESIHAVLSQIHVSRETSELQQSSRATTADVSRETLAREFREALTSVKRQELERAVTLVGPHRDDVMFELNGLPVKGYASHGETWSFALSLKLAIANLLRAELPSGDPVLILDDVFAELDSRRRNALMNQVSAFEQVIVTAAVESDVPAGDWHRVHIAAGKVQSQGSENSGDDTNVRAIADETRP